MRPKQILLAVAASLTFLVAALVAPRLGHACSCGIAPVVRPPDAATGVALNAAIVVQDPDAFDTRLQVLGGPDIALERTDLNPGRWLYLFRPTVELAPGTEYVVTIAGIDRSSFVTGDAVDSDGPVAPTLGISSAWTAEVTCFNSCERYDDQRVRIEGALGTADEVAYVEIGFSGETEETIYLVPEDFEFLSSLDTATCAVVPPRMHVGAEWCLTATAFDVAGNESASDTLCFAITECAVIDDCVTGPTACQPIGSDAGADDEGDDSGCAIDVTSRGGASHGAGLLMVVAIILAARRRRSR